MTSFFILAPKEMSKVAVLASEAMLDADPSSTIFYADPTFMRPPDIQKAVDSVDVVVLIPSNSQLSYPAGFALADLTRSENVFVLLDRYTAPPREFSQIRGFIYPERLPQGLISSISVSRPGPLAFFARSLTDFARYPLDRPRREQSAIPDFAQQLNPWTYSERLAGAVSFLAAIGFVAVLAALLGYLYLGGSARFESLLILDLVTSLAASTSLLAMFFVAYRWSLISNPYFNKRLILFFGLAFLVLVPVLAFRPVSTFAAQHGAEVKRILFATNRERLPATSKDYFGDNFSPFKRLTLGEATVRVPWTGDKSKLITLGGVSTNHPIAAIREITDGEFLSAVIASSDTLIYTHGFRTPFIDGVDSAAKLAADLKFQGIPILFSWPAGSAVSEYGRDLSNAVTSARHFRDFLETFRELRISRSQLIAHSMGARVTLSALLLMSDRRPFDRPMFNNIILAAADIDPTAFNDASPAARVAGSRVTLYVCDCDLPLGVSDFVNKLPRVGATVERQIGIDVIDAKNADLRWGVPSHSYLLNSRLVLSDMQQVIMYDADPRKRANIREDGCCWTFAPRR